MEGDNLKVSVVIPTYNEEKNIEMCLESLNNQTLPRNEYEIIVVDGYSNDRTRKLAKKYADKVILQKSNGVGGARNDGAKIAEGDIIATTDADIVVTRDWLETIVKNFNDKKIVCLFGCMRPMKNRGIYRIAFPIYNMLAYVGSRIGLHHNTCGANMAIRKDVFFEIGGFSDLPNSDDIEISMRLKKKGRVYCDRKLIVDYSTRRIEKFGFSKMVYIWTMNLIRLKRNKVINDNYAKQKY